MNTLNANVRGQLATRVLRMMGVCVIAIAFAASPAVARGTASSSFTVGIRIQSVPSPVMTPEQLNARNKALYEEQKASGSKQLVEDASNTPDTKATGQTASPTSTIAP